MFCSRQLARHQIDVCNHQLIILIRWYENKATIIYHITIFLNIMYINISYIYIFIYSYIHDAPPAPPAVVVGSAAPGAWPPLRSSVQPPGGRTYAVFFLDSTPIFVGLFPHFGGLMPHFLGFMPYFLGIYAPFLGDLFKCIPQFFWIDSPFFLDLLLCINL